MEDSNWRTQLPEETRRKVINKLMDELIKHARPPGPQEVSTVERLALRFEEKVFTTAISKTDYVTKISSKLLAIDKATKQEQPNFSSSSTTNTIENSAEQAFHRPLPQLHDQGQSLNHPGAHPQSHKHLSLQGAQNSIASATNSVRNIGQRLSSNNSSNAQMQVQGRQHTVKFVPQPDQHHVQNAPSQQSIMQASSVIQSPSMHGLQRNQQSSIKISIQSGPQKHLQSVSMRQQQPKPITIHQQITPKLQQPTMLQKQLQQSPNATKTHDLMNDQQNTVPNMQYQQQLLGQNSHSSINVHHFGLPSNISRFIGQSSKSGMHNDQQNSMWPQVCLEHQIQQVGSDLSASRGQPPRSHPSNQQMMSRLHVESAKLQPQTTPSRQNMLQRIQESGSLCQLQHQFDQSSESPSSFPVVSSMEVDCTSQKRVSDGDSWKEDVYQKIEMMKEKHLPELKEIYQRLAAEFRQFHSKSQHPKTADHERLNAIKALWERVFAFLHLRKSDISQDVARKLGEYDKMIYHLLQYNRSRRSISPLQQGQLTPSVVRSLQQPFQSRPQNPRLRSNGNQINPHLESVNLDQAVTAKGKSKVTTLRDGLAIPSGVTTAPQIKLNSQQPDTNFDSPQGNDVKLQVQNPANSCIYSSSSKSGVNVPQQEINHLMLHNMHLKQQKEQRMMQDQQAKQQLQQCQATKKAIQQREEIELQDPWRPSKLLEHRSLQLHQMNEVTSAKVGQAMGVKTGSFMKQNSTGQLLGNNCQLVNSDSPPSISSPPLQEASPQIYQCTSQQIDPKTLETYFTKYGTCPQSVALSRSISLAPSPVKEDSCEINSHVSLLENSGNGLQDGSQNNVSASEFFESSVTREPIKRLMKVVGSMSPKALSASVRDMESVLSMIDRTAGSIQGNGSTFGDELVPMSEFCLPGENLDSHPKARKIRHFVRVKPSNIVQSADSIASGFKQLTDPETCDMETDATSYDKRPRAKVNEALFKEIKEINQQLIGTVVDIIDGSVNSTTAVSVTEAGGGTIVRCSFNAVAICPDMKSELGSARLSNILPLRLLVPTNYPNCSPVLLDKLPEEVRGREDFSAKVMSKLHAILQNLAQPVSLREIARSWDACSRAVITEYACQNGGGSFSTTYGTWETHLSVA